MKTIQFAGFVVPVLSWIDPFATQETAAPPKMPEPVKEHDWLQQLVGEWEVDVEMFMEPGKPPEKTHGTETVRPIGGFWIAAESHGTCMGQPFIGLLTLGYDPGKGKYVGTWVGSMDSQLWPYEGALDPTGKALTLESEGSCPTAPGKLFKVREVMEITDRDHRTFTSSMQGEDGKWAIGMTIDYRRRR